MKKFFVDLDGVMADFEGAFNEKYAELSSLSHAELVVFKKKFAADGFFASLEVLPGAIELIEYLNGKGVVPTILTSVGKFESEITAAEKSEWVDKYLRPFVSVGEFAWTKSSVDKASFVVDENSVLVDDRTKSTDPWEAAGGTAVVYTDVSSAISEIERMI